MNPIIALIFQTFHQRGDLAYGTEAVTQRQHALQSAHLAEAEGADEGLIAAALLHDIGHILDAANLPQGTEANLDDGHEDRAYEWLLHNFGPRIADPVRLHVAAKRYLCTIDSSYEGKLSPTSYKSYLDQGGKMSDAERISFEAEPFYQESLRLRRWDDTAKDPDMVTRSLDEYQVLLESVFISK